MEFVMRFLTKCDWTGNLRLPSSFVIHTTEVTYHFDCILEIAKFLVCFQFSF